MLMPSIQSNSLHWSDSWGRSHGSSLTRCNTEGVEMAEVEGELDTNSSALK